MAAVTQVRILVWTSFSSNLLHNSKYYGGEFSIILLAIHYVCVILCIRKFYSPDRLVVKTLRCGRSKPGSNPGLDKFFVGHTS